MLMVSIKKIAWRLEPGLGYAIFVKCNEGLAQAAIRVGCALWAERLYFGGQWHSFGFKLV